MSRYVLSLFALFLTLPAHAGQPEARDIARLNNCPPKKIEIYSSALGSEGKTIYQVTCNLPKTTDKDAKGGPDALLIACDQSLCEMMRAVSLDKK